MSKKRERSDVIAKMIGDGVAVLSNSKNSGSIIRFDRNPSKASYYDI